MRRSDILLAFAPGALRFVPACLRITEVGWYSGTWRPWIRRSLALACGTGAFVCVRADEAGILWAIPLGILTGLLALPELLRPFFWLIDSLFGTGIQPWSRPPLDLRLARFYLREERWEEAFAEYERILSYYPRVEEGYVQLFKLGPRLGRSERWGQRLCRKALRRIREEAARSRLLGAWESAREVIRAQDASGGK